MEKSPQLWQQQSSQTQADALQKSSERIWDLYPQFLRFKINKYNGITLEVAILTLLKLTLTFHTLTVFLIISDNPAASILNKLIGIISENGIFSILLQVSIYLLKGCEIISLCAQVIDEQGSFFVGIGRRMMNNFNILVELDLTLSSFILLGNFTQNLFGFILTSSFYVFNTVFCVNYLDRRDVLYFSSLKENVFLTCLVLMNFMANSLIVYLDRLSLFTFTDLFLSVVLFGWYMKFGYLLVPNSGFSVFLGFSVTIKMGLSLLFLDYFFISQTITIASLVVKLILLCSVIYFCCRICQSQLNLFQNLLVSKSSFGTKYFDIFLNSLIEASTTDRQRQYYIMSMLSIDRHKKNLNDIYDFRSHTQIATQQTTKQTRLRAEIKQLYKRALEKTPKNQGIILDYCQFVLNEFNNLFQICKLLANIQKSRLNFLQYFRLSKLRFILQESNVAFNAVVFEGKMDLEHMIVAQAVFDEITVKIETTIDIQLKIWKTIDFHSINITDVYEMIWKKLQILKETSNLWTKIAKYMKHQMRWRYIYMNYSFFILNKRLVYRDTQQFRNSTEDNYFIGESTYLSEADSKERLYTEQILFDKKSFYIRAKIHEGTLLISNVSSSFQKLAEYSQNQVIGSPVHLLMTQEIKWQHDQKLLKWLQAGNCANQIQYARKFTSYVTKEGEEVPAVKYFKIFINVNDPQMLQFICLLKVNQQQIVSNQDQSNQSFNQLSVNYQKIKRDFKSSKRDNLKLDNNIFLKEDHLRTNNSIKQIQQAKKAIRLLTLTLIALIIMSLFVTRVDKSTIQNNLVQFLNFLNLYRLPMALSKNYMKLFLNVGTQSSVINQILYQTQSVQKFNSNPLTLKTLFDPSLNVDNKYLPFLNDSFNNGISYDQVQIYSIIISSISSLSRPPIIRTGYDFSMINMYLIPSYDHMINSTKIRFHQTFQENLSRMFMDQVIVAAVEIVAFAIIVIYVSLKIVRYLRKGKTVMDIILDFSELNVKRVQKYWKNIQKHFQKLRIRNKVYCLQVAASLRATQMFQVDLDIEIIRLKMQKQHNISYNKRERRVFETKKAKGNIIRSKILIFLALLILIVGLLSIQISNIVQIYHLQTFENDGFYFIRYYPATSVLGHALMERYYYQVKPSQVRYIPDRYAEYISSIYLIGQSSYVGPSVDSASYYYQKQKNYMFGNPCTFAPQVLTAANSNMTACMNGFNKTLNQGIATFLRAVHPMINNYINLKINLTVPELNDITTTLTIVAHYVTDAITTWTSEFDKKITDYESLDTLLCIIAAVIVLLLHLIFCEKYLFQFLERDYQFVREIFDKMIPNFVIQIEKVIRQKFVMQGIINQG